MPFLRGGVRVRGFHAADHGCQGFGAIPSDCQTVKCRPVIKNVVSDLPADRLSAVCQPCAGDTRNPASVVAAVADDDERENREPDPVIVKQVAQAVVHNRSLLADWQGL